MINEILGFLSTTLNVDSGQLLELVFEKTSEGQPDTTKLKPDAMAQLLELDATRVDTLVAGSGKPSAQALDEQYKRGQREAMELHETRLKKRHNITENLKGEALVDAILAKVQTSDLEEDKVKNHPLYRSLENQYTTEVEKLTTTHAQELEGIVSKQALGSRQERAVRAAMQKLQALDPDTTLPNYNSLLPIFERELRAYDYEFTEGRDLPDMILQDGKRLENQNRNALRFDEFVRQKAETFFVLKKQAAAGNAGNTGKVTGQTTPATGGSKWATEADFFEAYGKVSDNATRDAMRSEWNAQQAQTA